MTPETESKFLQRLDHMQNQIAKFSEDINRFAQGLELSSRKMIDAFTLPVPSGSKGEQAAKQAEKTATDQALNPKL